MNTSDSQYVDLHGQPISLAGLDADELLLLRQLQFRADEHPDWNDYSNYWMKAVGDFYLSRGLNRREVLATVPYRIAQDLCSRIGIAAGYVRRSDYRDELAQLIRTRFRTRREFCEATGLTEDMLSHVLAKRKHLAVDTLAEALARIGYALHITPMSPT